VNILLSTYNGEQFLAEQLRSLQAQTYRDWKLLVRDDGSTDGTLAILADFMVADSRISQLETRENLGSIDSFHALAKAAEPADYYFFCDQDDIWLPEKLQVVLDKAISLSPQTPRLIYSELKVVTQDLTVQNEHMVATQSGHPNLELIQELTENTVTGCTMMANTALIQLWRDTEDVVMHDWWLALLASAVGELIFIDQPLVLYRQHSNNVLGARTLNKRVKRWFSHWFRKYWWLITASQKQAEKLLAYDAVTTEQRKLITAFTTILTQKHRWQILQKYNLRKNKNFHTFVFRFLIITKFAYRSTK